MVDTNTSVYGISKDEWQAAYEIGIDEFAAHRFILMNEGDLIRIAFGLNGPPLDEKGARGTPVYTHALSVTPAFALELSRKLRDLLAAPKGK